MKVTKSSRLVVSVLLIMALMVPSLAFASQTTPSAPYDWQASTEGVKPPAADDADLAKVSQSKDPVRVIIKLEQPPLAYYRGGVDGLAPAGRTAGGKMDVQSAEAQAYLQYLKQQQNKFIVSLMNAVPSAKVQYTYQATFNGLTAQVPGVALPEVIKLVGRKNVSLAQTLYLDMDASIPAIGLYEGQFGSGWDMGLWDQLGGHENAGEGIKVAVIDSGIEQTHEFLSADGFEYPEGFPQGEISYTTEKVIVARVYLRPDEPADPKYDCACPQDHYGHGTHVAGTIAGRFNQMTPFVDTPISGVAPKAWLMNYKIFYTNIIDGGSGSEDPESLMAIEDAVMDGADVINNNWGGSAVDFYGDPNVLALEAAEEMGIVVIMAAGNAGPSANSLHSPGVGEPLITVGASTTNRVFALPVSLTGPGTIPPVMQNMAGVLGSGPDFAGPMEELYVDSQAAGSLLGCLTAGGDNPFPPGIFDGKIALIRRGTCTFAEKVTNAQEAGAIAVVVWNRSSGPASSMGSLEDTTIPSLMIEYEEGLYLQSFYTAHPGEATLSIDTELARLTKAAWNDRMADFSSKGPGPSLTIKPDLVAPGVNILSSVPDGEYELYQGTSMATPHVAGVSALIRQLHPEWSPQQVKSALVNTSKLPSSLDATCLDYDGAPFPGPMCRGAGRLWAGYPGGAGDPGLLFNPATISLGSHFLPKSDFEIEVPINVSSVLAYNAIFNVSWTSTDSFALAVAPSALTFPVEANGDYVLTATFKIDADTIEAGDYFGQVNFVIQSSGYYALHIPFWVRILPTGDLGEADVLLIDDDGSGAGLPGPFASLSDYRYYYTTTLETLGVSYAVLNVDYDTCASPWDIASRYDKVVWFTGDNVGYLGWCDFGILDPNISGMNRFMASGAKILLTGQDVGYYMYDWNDRDDDMKLYFGGSYVQDDLYKYFYTGNFPQASAEGMAEFNPFLKDVVLDFSFDTINGAKNQMYVDELNAMYYSDVDAMPLFKASLNSYSEDQALVGTRMSSEPTLERTQTLHRPETWTTLAYRSIWLSFGMEAVDEYGPSSSKPTGAYVWTGRSELMRLMLDWLDDEVRIPYFFTSTYDDFVSPNEAVAAMACAYSTKSAPLRKPASPDKSASAGIEYYRWDWGDGNLATYTNEIQETLGPCPAYGMAFHAYSQPGIYQVRVEVMDRFGHKQVSAPETIVVGGAIYLPLMFAPPVDADPVP
ncbi:MAG: S8 family serine peptidase [Chloroflexota bacterium]